MFFVCAGSLALVLCGFFLQGGLSREGFQPWVIGHALIGEYAGALELPVPGLVQQHRTYHALDRSVIGEDSYPPRGCDV